MIEVVSCNINGRPFKVADAKRVGLNGHRLSIKSSALKKKLICRHS